MSTTETVETLTPAGARAKLREAVERHQEMLGNLRKLEAAIAVARGNTIDKLIEIDRAKAAIARSSEVDADAIVEAVLSGATPTVDTTARKAREALAIAEDEYVASKALEAALDAKIGEHRTTLSYRSLNVDAALVDVVRTHSDIEGYIAETERLQQQLAARLRGLQSLIEIGILDRSARFDFGFVITPDHAWLSRAHAQPADVSARWAAMFAKLRADPAAPAKLT